MKHIVATLLVWIAITGMALAAHEADMSITTSFDEDEMQGMFGGLTAEEQEMGMTEEDLLGPTTISGHMYWTETGMRLDFDSIEGVGSTSTIYNFADGVMYQLDHDTKKATSFDISSEEMPAGAEMDGFAMMDVVPDSPEELIHNWDEVSSQLQGMEGINFVALGNKTVNGRSCMGYSISMDTSEMDMQGMGGSGEGGSAEDDMFGGLLDMILGMLEIDMEVWVDESITMPVSISMVMMGMTTDMDLMNITEWSADPNMFVVPESYTIEPFRAPTMPGPGAFTGMPPGATVPGQSYLSED